MLVTLRAHVQEFTKLPGKHTASCDLVHIYKQGTE